MTQLWRNCIKGTGTEEAEEVRQGQQGQLNMIVNCIVGSNGLHSWPLNRSLAQAVSSYIAMRIRTSLAWIRLSMVISSMASTASTDLEALTSDELGDRDKDNRIQRSKFAINLRISSGRPGGAMAQLIFQRIVKPEK